MKVTRTPAGLRAPRGHNAGLLAAAILLLSAVSAPAQQAQTTATEGWQFILTPYLWVAGMSGTARVGSVVPAENVDASFSDLLSSLDWGAMATFEARQDRWGIIADAMYIQLSKSSQPLLDGALGTAEFKGNNTLVEAAGAYRAWRNDSASLDVLLGVRYFDLSANITLYPSKLLPAGRYASNRVDWTDGFAGLRAQWRFAEKWWVLGYADIGTGGSNYSYQAIAAVGWDISKTFALQLGYRLLAEDYNTSSFLYDMRMGGPYLGLSITF